MQMKKMAEGRAESFFLLWKKEMDDPAAVGGRCVEKVHNACPDAGDSLAMETELIGKEGSDPGKEVGVTKLVVESDSVNAAALKKDSML
jgi:hypothetical protein